MIVAIAGSSCSGKSTLARELADLTSATYVSLDDCFFRPGEDGYIGSPYAETVEPFNPYPDCDRYEAINWAMALDQVTKAPGDVIIEGFLALGHETVRAMSDAKLFVDIEPDQIREREELAESRHTRLII